MIQDAHPQLSAGGQRGSLDFNGDPEIIMPASPAKSHESQFQSKRTSLSIEVVPPPRSMTMSTKRLSYSDIDRARRVKYGKGAHSDVELVPQPSDDPEDPLVRRPINGNV
jgi:hypothetical protein